MVSPLQSIVAGNRGQDVGQFFRSSAQTADQLQNSALNRDATRQQMDIRGQQADQQQNEIGKEEAIGAGRYINVLAKQLLATDEMQWPAILEPNMPQLQKIGYTPEMLQGLSRQQIESVIQQTEPLMKQSQTGDSVRVKEFNKWKAMPEGDEKEALGKIIGAVSRGESTDAYIARKQGEADVRLGTAAGIKAEEKRGASTEAREQGFIDSGIDAAESMVTVSRAISLLDDLETGGFNNTALKAKQLFGIESANEAELSNALGVAVLAQLKPIFGAAFTVQEGDRLEKLSAGFGKSTEGNRRILNQQLKMSDRAARRALKLAKSKGDQFTVEEIESTLEAIKDIKSGASGNALDPNTESTQDDTALFSKYGIE